MIQSHQELKTIRYQNLDEFSLTLVQWVLIDDSSSISFNEVLKEAAQVCLQFSIGAILAKAIFVQSMAPW